MKLRQYLFAIMLALVSVVAGASEIQAEDEATASNSNCWWIFCVNAGDDPVPMGPGGGGDPPGPNPN